ncbi:MAG TPA: MYXO-CTERM sorting domain-containing protein, partial [Nannocystis sp.]
GGTVSVTVTLGAPGIYENSATLTYRAGVNTLTADSNVTMTAYGVAPTTDGTTSGDGTGPTGETGGTGGTGGGASGPEPTGGGGPGGASTSAGSSGGSDGASDTATDSHGQTETGGCGCRGDGGDAGGAAALLGLAALVRRRRGA